uniref:Uncharacterized protein n=1 Tax=Davidia involucrata TaxID=16924 RepID=A0A5B7A2C2_DAVIN
MEGVVRKGLSLTREENELLVLDDQQVMPAVEACRHSLMGKVLTAKESWNVETVEVGTISCRLIFLLDYMQCYLMLFFSMSLGYLLLFASRCICFWAFLDLSCPSPLRYQQNKPAHHILCPKWLKVLSKHDALGQNTLVLSKQRSPEVLCCDCEFLVCCESWPAHIPLYLYPFLNTRSNSRPFEYLRLTSLGVIGALVKPIFLYMCTLFLYLRLTCLGVIGALLKPIFLYICTLFLIQEAIQGLLST